MKMYEKQVYSNEERNIAIFGYQCSTSLITLNVGLRLNRDWGLKRCRTCTHHEPISICTSLGQLAFTFYFLCFLLSIATDNIVGRILTFKHYQFIHCFYLPALHCDMTLNDISLNFGKHLWETISFSKSSLHVRLRKANAK